MPGKEIKGRSKIANYRHCGRTGFKHSGLAGKLMGQDEAWEKGDKMRAEAAHELAKRGKKQKTFFWQGHRIVDTPKNRKIYKDK